jgi:hypothetical protein
MFSDLVGSTALSARMDPEDLREVISAYQKCVAETVRRFGGFVAKYMGDGVLVRRHGPDGGGLAVRAMPLMTNVRAVTVFRFFRGYQLVFAPNAVFAERGAATGYHRCHGDLLDTDPDKFKLSIIDIRASHLHAALRQLSRCETFAAPQPGSRVPVQSSSRGNWQG